MNIKFSQQLLCDIQTIRLRRQLSYRQLAKESFVHRDVLWKLFEGKVNKISLHNLDRLYRYRKKWENYIESNYL